jgi:hypothetical protein
VNHIWKRLADHNNFIFQGDTLEDIWFLYAFISFKHAQLVKMIRGEVLWIIWLERNNLYFNIVEPNFAKIINIMILSLVHF